MFGDGTTVVQEREFFVHRNLPATPGSWHRLLTGSTPIRFSPSPLPPPVARRRIAGGNLRNPLYDVLARSAFLLSRLSPRPTSARMDRRSTCRSRPQANFHIGPAHVNRSLAGLTGALVHPALATDGPSCRQQTCRVQDERELRGHMDESSQEGREETHCGEGHPYSVHGERAREVLHDDAARPSRDPQGLD